MCTILLSIKPDYVEKIFDGSKRYEFRRIACKDPVDKIIIYATSPTKKVVGEVVVEKILSASPTALWEQTKNEAGISRKFFREYFKGKKSAFAYKLGEVIKYNTPQDLSDLGIPQAPQSFVYV